MVLTCPDVDRLVAMRQENDEKGARAFLTVYGLIKLFRENSFPKLMDPTYMNCVAGSFWESNYLSGES